MKELLDMSQAHLQNVQQEVEKLVVQRNQIDSRIEELKQYLQTGVETITKYKTESVSTEDSILTSSFNSNVK